MSTASRRIRRPAVAGTFYPADRASLLAALRGAFDDARPPAEGEPAPKALVVPHAGYRYSGAIAASGYLRLGSARDRIRRVVLAGPAHRVTVAALGTTSADAWRTPLGDVDIDLERRDLVLGDPAVEVADRALAPEHSLEVHLPFLQVVLAPGWRLLPLVVGRASVEQVARVLETCWGGDDTLVVVSTDLSHYHDHATATSLDHATAAAVVARRTDLAPTDACGAHPLAGLLDVADRRDLAVRCIDLRNSGDTQGDRSRVVGYGAFTCGELAGAGAA